MRVVLALLWERVIMKWLARALAVLMASSASAEQAKDGPFGFKAGDVIANYPACSMKDRPDSFDCIPARPHPDLKSYNVWHMPDIGICMVVAFSGTIETGVFGVEARSATDGMAKQIEMQYGKAEKLDFLMPSSIWRESRDWMMSVKQKERYYEYIWEKLKKNRVNQIAVKFISVSENIGMISVAFLFDNFKKCQEADRRKQSGAF